MAKITITGQPPTPRNPAFGASDDYANANWLNQDYNARVSFQRRQQIARERAEREKFLGDYREATYQNSQMESVRRAQEAARRAAERNAASRFNLDYRSAAYENRDMDIRRRAAERNAASRFNLDYRAASYENRDMEIRRRAAERNAASAYNQAYREAAYENQNYNIRARRDARAASALYPNQYRSAVAAGVSSSSLGTMGGAYYNQEARRLGGVGTNAVNRGELKELILIDRHLAHMSKNLDKYVRSNSKTSQEQEADRKKAREILAESYSNISAAAQYAPGAKGMVMRAVVARRAAKARMAAGGGFYGGGAGGGGSGIGGGKGGFGGGFFGTAAGGAIGDMFELGAAALDPLAAAAAVGGAVYEVPHAISAIYNGAYNAAKPYINLRRTAGAYGLNAVTSGQSILHQFYRSHGAAPSLMQAYGLSGQDAFNILGQYGIVPRSASSAARTVGKIAGMGFMPGLAGMGTDTYATIARMQGEYGGQGYTKKFQKVMEDAVAVGTDRSRIFQSMRTLLQQNVTQGGFTGGARSATAIFNRMMTSGAPAARTGASELAFSTSLSSTGRNLGLNPTTSIPVYRAMMAHGGMPNTPAKLKSLIGEANYNKLVATPAGARLAQDIMNAPNAFVAQRFLGQYYSTHQHQLAAIDKKYGYFTHGPSSLRDLGFSAATGAPLSASVQYLSGFGGNTSNYGAGASASPLVMNALASASKKTGMPVSFLYGLAGGESSFKTNAVNGSHIGLGQMGPAALASVGMSGANMLNPKTAALASAKYMAQMYGLFNGHHLSAQQHLVDAYDAYYWGPGHAKQILAGDVPASIAAGTARKMRYYHAYLSATGQTQQENQKMIGYFRKAEANTKNLDTTNSRNAGESLLTALEQFGGSATAFANATANFNAGVLKFINALNHVHGSGLPGGGYAAGHLGLAPKQP